MLKGIFSSIKTSLLCSFNRTVLASTSFNIRLKSSLSTRKKWQLFSFVIIVAERGDLLTKDNLPKSSPSCNVETIPFPCIDTSTEPFKIIYQDSPSSPWLKTKKSFKSI